MIPWTGISIPGQTPSVKSYLYYGDEVITSSVSSIARDLGVFLASDQGVAAVAGLTLVLLD